jgi:CRISPR-associated protein (TIGR02710 family)
VKVLVLTVGGSYAPLLTSIETIHPDRVVFLCSDDVGNSKGSYTQVEGPGMVLCSKPPQSERLSPDRPNLVTLAKLPPDKYEVIKIKQLDSLQEAYKTAVEAIERIREDHPEAQIIADYTGGTKSMTAALALAAADDEKCELSLVTGTRPDLSAVQHNTQFAHPVAVWDLRARRKLREADAALRRFDYAAAVLELEQVGATHISDSLLGEIRVAIAACRAFDAWDRFDHLEARRLLEPYKEGLIDRWLFLEELCQDNPKDPYLRVEDLLFNSERRGVQGRFDDAVARLYRAFEMLAQIPLKRKYGIETSNVDVSKVPADLTRKFEIKRRDDGKLPIGLVDAWELLSSQRDDALGAWFKKEGELIKSFLAARNQSILAHGTQPISKDMFQRTGQKGLALCRGALQHLPPAERGKRKAIQLPQGLPWLPSE